MPAVAAAGQRMPKINFSICVNENVKPSVHQGTMYSTLNLLPLPTPALPGSGVVVSGQWVSSELIFTIHNSSLTTWV